MHVCAWLAAMTQRVPEFTRGEAKCISRTTKRRDGKQLCDFSRKQFFHFFARCSVLVEAVVTIGPLLGCAIGPTRSRSRGEMLCAFARGSALLWIIGPLKKSCHLALPRPFLKIWPCTKPCQLALPRPFVKTKCAKAKCCVFCVLCCAD